MSGGSYNYLYSRELADPNVVDDLQRVQSRLAGLGYAADVAVNVSGLLREVEDAEQRKAALSGVLQALEWWDSNDWSEDQFQEALAKYRAAEEEQ